MADWFHHRVVAHLTDGRQITTPMPSGTVSAQDPASAARKWYWRLDPGDRRLVDRLIVWAPIRPLGATPPYSGPIIVFRPIGGALVEVERR